MISFKSLLITFLWGILGVSLIFAAVFYSTSNASNDFLTKNISLILIISLGVLLFVFLPAYLVFRVIKDWGIKPRTEQEAYFRKANNGVGLFMLTNILLGFYVAINAGKIVDLSIFSDPVLIIGGFISYSFLSWGLYNLVKSKNQPGWLVILSVFYPLGLIVLLFLPDKLKK